MKRIKVLISGLLIAGSLFLARPINAAGNDNQYACARHSQVYIGGKPLYVGGKPIITARGCIVRLPDNTTRTIGHDARYAGNISADGTLRVRLLSGQMATTVRSDWRKSQ